MLYIAIILLCVFIYKIFKKPNGISEYASIFFFVIAIIMTFDFIELKFINYNIGIKNATAIDANISWVSNEITESEKISSILLSSAFKKSSHQSKQKYYAKKIGYTYVVNNVEYSGIDNLESTNKRDLENMNRNIIKILYDAKNPNDSKIKPITTNEDIFNVITILVFFIMAVILRLGSTPLPKKYLEKSLNSENTKKKGKNTYLTVLKIDFIDYERERVFFKNEKNKIYYYETELGENFEVNSVYEIILNHKNQETERIKYEGNNIKAIKIINTEKNEFIKK